MATPFKKFAKLVEAAGLKAIDRRNGHWQITGGAMLVNYYPQKRTIYVAGTTGSTKGDAAAAIKATRDGPGQLDTKDHRRTGGYRKAKDRMYARDPRCHWCPNPMTREEATLDHRIPLSRGGLDNANNWVLAHKQCNHGRGNSLPSQPNNVSVTVFGNVRIG